MASSRWMPSSKLSLGYDVLLILHQIFFFPFLSELLVYCNPDLGFLFVYLFGVFCFSEEFISACCFSSVCFCLQNLRLHYMLYLYYMLPVHAGKVVWLSTTLHICMKTLWDLQLLKKSVIPEMTETIPQHTSLKQFPGGWLYPSLFVARICEQVWGKPSEKGGEKMCFATQIVTELNH